MYLYMYRFLIVSLELNILIIKELLSQIKIDIKINMSLKEELKTLEMIIEGDPLSYM